jgi:hypothetical protein
VQTDDDDAATDDDDAAVGGERESSLTTPRRGCRSDLSTAAPDGSPLGLLLLLAGTCLVLRRRGC